MSENEKTLKDIIQIEKMNCRSQSRQHQLTLPTASSESNISFFSKIFESCENQYSPNIDHNFDK